MQILREGLIKKQKKAHRCCKCDRIIHVGEPAYFQVNVGADWGFCQVHWHVECNHLSFDEDD